jgi:hypothetical protein
MTISRELLGKIVDEVFDGAIEDASVIEEIYTVIMANLSTASLALQPQAREVGVKKLDWQDAKDRGYSQADCELGQYQVGWLGEFECWQCSRPHRRGLDWKDNFSRHASKDEAKAAAQLDYERRIRSALIGGDAL